VSAGSERLERSRLAILEHIHHKELRRHRAENAGGENRGDHPRWAWARRGEQGWLAQASEAVQDWWRHHPAHTALELARPALTSYARRKPMQYLGLAAAGGAALLLMRPWKLISATGVLMALVKSPQVAAMVMSALSSSENPLDDQAADDE
jgi:hypothetical protein